MSKQVIANEGRLFSLKKNCGWDKKFSRLSRKQNYFFDDVCLWSGPYCHIVRCFYPRNNSHTYQGLQFFVGWCVRVEVKGRKYIVQLLYKLYLVSDKTFSTVLYKAQKQQQ